MNKDNTVDFLKSPEPPKLTREERIKEILGWYYGSFKPRERMFIVAQEFRWKNPNQLSNEMVDKILEVTNE